jgi:hypothetical protein
MSSASRSVELLQILDIRYSPKCPFGDLVKGGKDIKVDALCSLMFLDE